MSENIILNVGGGSNGAALNFKVVGNPQPASPSENTIWVNTDTPITGYEFSATEPVEPIEGMVWISTGTSSPVEFNALKKNGIQVYPISVKQYVGGAWVDKEAKTYQNGAWAGWRYVIYSPGNTHDNITGGMGHVAGNRAGVSYVDSGINITFTSSSSEDTQYALVYTKNKIDLTEYSTLNGLFSGTSEEKCEFLVGIRDAIPTSSHDACSVFNLSTGNASGTDKEISLDISNVTGEHYIVVGRRRTLIKQIWLA